MIATLFLTHWALTVILWLTIFVLHWSYGKHKVPLFKRAVRTAYIWLSRKWGYAGFVPTLNENWISFNGHPVMWIHPCEKNRIGNFGDLSFYMFMTALLTIFIPFLSVLVLYFILWGIRLSKSLEKQGFIYITSNNVRGCRNKLWGWTLFVAYECLSSESINSQLFISYGTNQEEERNKLASFFPVPRIKISKTDSDLGLT